MCRQKKHPSVSRFERGRGGDGGGCVDRETTPSVSHFERGRGGGGGLTFQASEGMALPRALMLCDEEGFTPPRVSPHRK